MRILYLMKVIKKEKMYRESQNAKAFAFFKSACVKTSNTHLL